MSTLHVATANRMTGAFYVGIVCPPARYFQLGSHMYLYQLVSDESIKLSRARGCCSVALAIGIQCVIECYVSAGSICSNFYMYMLLYQN